MKEEKDIWAYWDCPYCKTKHIRGDKEECTSCGSPRSAETEFYLDDDISDDYVTEEEQETMNLTDEENWICSYCKAQNVATTDVCSFCGASRAEKSGDYFEEHDKVQQVAEEVRDNIADIVSDVPQQEQSSQKKTPQWLGYVIFIFACIALIFGGAMLYKYMSEPIPKTATVNSVEWQRSIQIQQLVTEKDSGWSLPSGAELQETKEEIKTHKKVVDHYESKTVTKYRTKYKTEKYTETKRKNMGNGRYKSVTETKTRKVPYKESYKETVQEPVYRNEPVYATKYYYLIDRWKNTRSVDTHGDTKEVYWGEVVLESKERESERKEIYTVNITTSDNETHSVSVSYDLWKQCEKGTVLHYTETRAGKKSDLSL